jgi:hypothetical protein
MPRITKQARSINRRSSRADAQRGRLGLRISCALDRAARAGELAGPNARDLWVITFARLVELRDVQDVARLHSQ